MKSAFSTPSNRILGFILALTILVFIQTLSFDFAGFDDMLLITRNPTAQGLSLQNITAAFTTYDPELYVPITLLSYQVEHSIAGLSPWIYHLTNLVIHLLCTVLVFIVFRKLARFCVSKNDAYYVAGFVALMFALHPLNVQTVAWAAARKDSLSTLFALLSIALFLQYKESNHKKLWYWSIGFFALGLAAKVSIVLLPFILLLASKMHLEKSDRRSLVPFIPYFALSGIFGLIALGGKQQQLSTLTLADTILLGAKSTYFYVQNLFTPGHLALFYHHTGEITLLKPTFYFPMIIILLMIILAAVSYKRQRHITFGILFFFLLLLPTFFNFWKNGFIDIASDRYAYLALSGLTFSIGIILIPHLKYRRTAGVILGVVLAGSSFIQTRIWSDGETLLRATLRNYPDSTHALMNLGVTMHEKGNSESALALYDQAIALDPNLAPAYLNKARVVAKTGDIKEAIILTKKSISVISSDRITTPDELQAFFFLGVMYEQVGELEKAFLAFSDATAYAPESSVAFFNLGVMFQKYSHPKEARDAFNKAYALEPKGLENRYRLAAVEAELGNLPFAILHLEYILKKDPHYEQAAKHLKALRSSR